MAITYHEIMKLLSMKQAAVRLGFSEVHGHKTIQRYIKQGKLSCVRIGKVVRISEEELNLFIREHTQQPEQEEEQEEG